MNHRSRPDLPPQWRSSTHPPQPQAKSPTSVLPVVPDPSFSLSSPPESPPPTFPFPASTGKGPARTRPKRPPTVELQEIEDEYAPKPYNPYNLPPASVIAVEVGSQSQVNNSSRVSPREDLENPAIHEDEDSDVAESRAITISTFFSPDLDARLPRTPDSDDNVGKRGRPVTQKRLASRGAGGAIRSAPRTTRVSPMTTPTQSRFSRDTRDRDSHETSFACAGAKAVTNNSKRRNLAALLGIKTKGTNKSASKADTVNDENMMDLDGGLDDLKKLKIPNWGEAASDVESWDENFFAAGGGREDRGSGEGDGNGQWTEYLQAVGDAMTIASADFMTPRAAPVPPNPSLPTIPTVPSLSPLTIDDATQNASVVTSTPRTKERAKKNAKRTGRILSTGFPSPMEIHAVPTTTFGLGLEGIEMELAMAIDTDFMDVDSCRDVNTPDADGDVHMDQLTDVTPTMTTKTTVTNGKTKDKSRAMDAQRQQQPTPAESTVRLPPTSLSLKTPFGGSNRSFNPLASNTTLAKPFSLPQNKQLLLTRSLTPRTPLSGSKPPAQKLMGKTLLSLPSVSTAVAARRPARWNEPSPVTPAQQPLSPLSPSPTPSPEQTPCPPERLTQIRKPARPAYAVDKPLPVPNVAKGKERVGAVSMTKDGPRADIMDEVWMCAQIDECIAATDRMEETLRSCSYFDSTPFMTICDLLKGALVEMMGTIAGGAESSRCSEVSASSVAVTQEILQWRQKHELLEQSVQKNVHKFYQLAEHTCDKPPRISRIEERMDKLVAYLRKFRDLNIRILASYDKLRILLLSGRLASAVALVRANSTSNSKRRHEDITMSVSTSQRPKQRQKPSATGPVKPSRSGDGTYTRKRTESFTVNRTTRNQNAPSQTTRNVSQMTRSSSVDEESTADMFTARSRYTHTSKGVQAKIRDTRESTRETMISPPLTASDSSQTYRNIPTRSDSRVYTVNPIRRTNSHSKVKANSLHKTKALSPLENFV